MKKYYQYITCLFLLLFACKMSDGQIRYTSADPSGQAGTEARMLRISYNELYKIGAKSAPLYKGGILANAAGGEVKMNIYYYDLARQKRKLIYQCYTKVNNATEFIAESNEIWPDSWWLDALLERDFNTWKSTDIDKMGIAAGVYASGSNSNIVSLKGKDIPIIVEIVSTGSNVTVSKIKIPTLGIIDINELSARSTPIADVKGNVTLGAHRGSWQNIGTPENTKLSITQMMNDNYDMVELDLWTTKDGKVIVFHDEGLNKRTDETGSVKARNFSEINTLDIKNRFDEIIPTSNDDGKIVLLETVLAHIKSEEIRTGRKILINLDRSANDMDMFKRTYQVVRDAGVLDRAIFKGRFDPSANIETGVITGSQTIAPTAKSVSEAIRQIYSGTLTEMQILSKIKLLRFTPILFDNVFDPVKFPNDTGFARKIKNYIDNWVDAGMGDGFELNYKSNAAGDFKHSTVPDENNFFLLNRWQLLGNNDGGGGYRNFVDYVHSKNLPVGIFASVPEVCAIPGFNADGSRNTSILVSGFVKEEVKAIPPALLPTYNRKIQQQADFDFRGDWDFYIPAGADYVITDRPDALREYLKAIGRLKIVP